MTRFLAENAERVGRATCRGRLYRIAHYPGLVPSKDARDVVVGDVFRLGDPVGVLKRLDKYEGCGPASPKPTEYVREMVVVASETGGQIEAWTYLYNWPVEPSALIRSGDFLRR